MARQRKNQGARVPVRMLLASNNGLMSQATLGAARFVLGAVVQQYMGTRARASSDGSSIFPP